MLKTIVSSALLSACVATSQAALLTFDGFSTNSVIPQTYGDTATVDVSYQQQLGWGNRPASIYTINQWPDSYGDLVNVAWGAGPNSPDYVGSITFTATPGHTVTLNSFDLAGYLGDQPNISVFIYYGDFNLAGSWMFMMINGNGGHTTLTANVTSSVIHLQWTYPWGVGIDNISYDSQATTVPDGTSTAVLGLMSLAGLLSFRSLKTVRR